MVLLPLLLASLPPPPPQCSSVEHQLANVRQTVAGLEHERGSLMDHIGSLTHALTEVKGELQASQENGSRLAAMLAQEQTRVGGREGKGDSEWESGRVGG